MKRALILGVTGQDGSYMAEFLLKKKYKVYGLVRKSATSNTKNIDHLIKNKKIFNKNFFTIGGDLLDLISLNNAIEKSNPDEVYNFADQDHVGWSFMVPTYSYNVTVIGVMNVLESLKKRKRKIKYFQPTSSNMFGDSLSLSQNENTSFNPLSIYALGKVSAYYLCKMYNKVRKSIQKYAKVYKSTQMYAKVCKSMQKYAKVCKVCISFQKYAEVCRSMQKYVKVCEIMLRYAKVCKVMCNSIQSYKKYAIIGK